MLEKLDIKNIIYEVRGKQVMLDSDLAKLYQCKSGTKVVNQAVSRHKDRFPNDFCFQLTKEEYSEILRSQLVTLELKKGKYYNDLTVRNTFDIKLLQESFDKLEEKKKNNEIYSK